MKKILIFILVLLISLSFVSSAGIFTIMSVTNQLGQFVPGLQVPGELQELVNQVVCVSNPLSCAQGKIVGQLSSELYRALPPEIREAYDTYNKIDGYVQQGAQIVDKLQIQDGKITSGSIKFGKEGSENTVKFSGVLSPEVIKTSTGEQEMKLTFSGKDSQICFEEKKTCYTNINEKTSSFIILGEDGNIKEADLTTSNQFDKTPIVFGDQMVNVPPNTRVRYDGTNIIVYSDKETEFSISDYHDGKSTNQKDYKILGKGNVVFTGYGAEVPPNVGLYDKKFDTSYMNTGTDILFVTDNKENVGPYKNWIVANKESLEFDAKARVNFGKDNPWVKMKETDTLSMNFDAEGILSKNVLIIESGDVVTLNCDNKITYQTNLFYRDNEEFCVPMTFISESGMYTLNEDGSAKFQFCSQPSTSITGGSIFDVLTGRFILWVTGMQAAPEIGGCSEANYVSDQIYYAIDKKFSSYENCPGNLGVHNNEQCKYTPDEIKTLSGLCDKAKMSLKQFPTQESVIKNKETICGAYEELSGKESKKVSTNLSPEPKKQTTQATPEPKPVEKKQLEKCSCLVDSDSTYLTCITNLKDTGNTQLCNVKKLRDETNCALNPDC